MSFRLPLDLSRIIAEYMWESDVEAKCRHIASRLCADCTTLTCACAKGLRHCEGCSANVCCGKSVYWSTSESISEWVVICRDCSLVWKQTKNEETVLIAARKRQLQRYR